MFFSLVGTWVQSTAQSWLVFELTRSAFLLGVVGFIGTFPMALFSLPAGVFVDRKIKRNLLIGTQASLMVLAFLLAILVRGGSVRVWHIMILAFMNGLVFSVDAPVRQAMVVELVGKQHLFNAITLNSAAFNSARLIGPAIAGVLIGVIGMAGCFYINAASFIPLLLALFLIRPRPVPANEKFKSVKQDIVDALVLLRQNTFLMALLGLVAVFSMFGAAYVVLMTIFAQDILHTGPRGFALLMSCNGAGALIGVLNLARLKAAAPQERMLKFSIILFFVAMMMFAVSRSFIFSCVLLSCVGFGASSGVSIINTLLQLNIPDAYRGRIMGVYIMMFTGLMPLGNLGAGVLTHFWSASRVVFFGALTGLLLCITIAVTCLTPKPRGVCEG
jgi:MFS family permease